MRFVAWLALPLIAAGLLACSSDEKGGPSLDELDAGGGGGKADASKTDSSTPADSSADSSPSGDSAVESSADASDEVAADSSLMDSAPPDVSKDVVVEYNIQPCPVATQAIGSKGFAANGASSDAFVEAYNAELSTMNYPGPMLMVFQGLNSVDSAGWKLKVGPLSSVDGSGKVSFGATPAEIPFSLGEGFTINLPQTPASFSLRFATATTTADLPVASILVSGLLDSKCSALSVETIFMFIPSSAASLPFHGSTVGELMGKPDQDINGGKANAWFLSLAGSAEPVELQ